MKKFSLIIVLTLLGLTGKAQDSFIKNQSYSIGYYGHFGFHPGIKIGTQLDIKTTDKIKTKKRGELVKQKTTFISPQIGFYTHPRSHNGLLLNVEIGRQHSKKDRPFYHSYALGLGYMAQFNSSLTYQQNSDGTFTTKQYASKSYFMPSLSAEIGQTFNSNIGWYSKISFGSKLFYNTGVSLEGFIELGLKFKL